jgi:hypothetical protein
VYLQSYECNRPGARRMAQGIRLLIQITDFLDGS